jgi:hypothetical protein
MTVLFQPILSATGGKCHFEESATHSGAPTDSGGNIQRCIEQPLSIPFACGCRLENPFGQQAPADVCLLIRSQTGQASSRISLKTLTVSMSKYVGSLASMNGTSVRPNGRWRSTVEAKPDNSLAVRSHLHHTSFIGRVHTWGTFWHLSQDALPAIIEAQAQGLARAPCRADPAGASV